MGAVYPELFTGPSPGVADFSDRDQDRLSGARAGIQFFGSTDALNGGADDDRDSDGPSNYNEFRAGTDPTDPNFIFCFQSLELSGVCVFSWSSETGKVYSLWYSTNLISSGFARSAHPIPATPPINTYTTEGGTTETVCYQMQAEDDWFNST